MTIDPAHGVTVGGGLLAMLGGGAVAPVFLHDWTHGTEPTVAALLLLGILLSVFGIGLAMFAVIHFRRRFAWLIAGLNGIVLIASFQGFRLL